MKKKHKNKLFWALFLILLFAVLYWFRQPLLMGMGLYLAPSETAKADVVIIEGAKTIDAKAVREAIGILKAGQVKKIVLVIHDAPEGEEIFPLSGTAYPRMISRALIKEGLKTQDFEILRSPVDGPVTLKEAETVLARLSIEKHQSASLMAESFHMRRSLLAYRQAGKAMNIIISPSPYFVGYRLESWWQKADGFRDYFSEALKLFYYIVRGYIPFRSVFTINI